MRQAVVWIAGGESYTTDAETSCASVKQHNPGLMCILATDYHGKVSSIYDRVIRLPPRRYPDIWFLDSVYYTNIVFDTLYGEYDSFLILDTDCFCSAPLDDMLQLAERFDLCASHGVTRQTTNTFMPIPDAFAEFEVGVMLVSCNEHVRSLFRDWLELYENHVSLYGNNDQGPFREAIWINKYINIYILPEEYHCRWGFGACVVSTVRILHSRSCGENPHTNAQAAIEINSVGGRRLFNSEGLQGKPVAGGM